jgi:hypothetical protein
MKPPAPMPTTPGVIAADECYRLDEFCRRAGLTASAMRAARRAGLPVRRQGKRAFVIGADWIQFLQQPTISEVRPVLHAGVEP